MVEIALYVYVYAYRSPAADMTIQYRSAIAFRLEAIGARKAGYAVAFAATVDAPEGSVIEAIPGLFPVLLLPTGERLKAEEVWAAAQYGKLGLTIRIAESPEGT